MSRRENSGWGRTELAEARELAAMINAGIVQTARRRLLEMPCRLRVATAVTVVTMLDEARVPPFHRWLRSLVPDKAEQQQEAG